MKRALLVVLLLALAAAPASAQAKEMTFLEGFQIGWVYTDAPPVVKCIGGELVVPAPPYYVPCSEGTQHVIARNEVQTWTPAPGQDVPPVLDGAITFQVNCNMNGNYRGPCFGAFEWTVPGVGGKWVGTWTSPVMDLLTYESVFSMVGHGVGGEIDGKQLKFDGGSAPLDWYVTGTIRIK
jgi:hypothetical protein